MAGDQSQRRKDSLSSTPPLTTEETCAPLPDVSKDRTRAGSDLLTASQLPSISLPKGGGAIKGIGEKFSANPVTGTSALSVPLPISPGRAGLQPALALAYDSGAGNGPF